MSFTDIPVSGLLAELDIHVCVIGVPETWIVEQIHWGEESVAYVAKHVNSKYSISSFICCVFLISWSTRAGPKHTLPHFSWSTGRQLISRLHKRTLIWKIEISVALLCHVMLYWSSESDKGCILASAHMTISRQVILATLNPCVCVYLNLNYAYMDMPFRGFL